MHFAISCQAKMEQTTQLFPYSSSFLPSFLPFFATSLSVSGWRKKRATTMNEDFYLTGQHDDAVDGWCFLSSLILSIRSRKKNNAKLLAAIILYTAFGILPIERHTAVEVVRLCIYCDCFPDFILAGLKDVKVFFSEAYSSITHTHTKAGIFRFLLGASCA